MKSVLRLIGLAGFGVFVAAACGGDDDSSPGQTKASTGGGAGKGGSSAGHAGQSGAGRSSMSGGTGDQSGVGGSAGSARGGAGGTLSAGKGGKSGAGGKGGSAGHVPGTGGSNAAGAGAGGHDSGGEAGAPVCVAATAKEWIDVSKPPYVGVVGSYATWLESSSIASDSVIKLDVLLPDTGSFELGTGDDANFRTCNRCLFADAPLEVGGDDREFFADSGTLYIDPSSDAIHGVIHAELSNVHLIEVTRDPDTALSTPVPGGGCITIASSHIEFPPPDGSGGAAGAGGEGGGAGAPTIPDDCTEITAGDFVAVARPTYEGYLATISPNLGTLDQDLLGLELFTNDTGTITLGQGVNSEWETCEQCFLANVPDGSYYGRNFFAYQGTLEIEGSSIPRSGTLDATATDVTFLEVDAGLEPLAGGACLHLASASISLP